MNISTANQDKRERPPDYPGGRCFRCCKRGVQ